MSFAGIKNPQDRANLIAYLEDAEVTQNEQMRNDRKGGVFLVIAILCISHPLIVHFILPAQAASFASPSTAIANTRPDFKHFDYVNPDAPKGGEVKLAEVGTFDDLNPFILNGVKAPGLDYLFESLMVQSHGRAEVDVWADCRKRCESRRIIAALLSSCARKRAGMTARRSLPDDVVFSFNTLKEKGDPSYKILYAHCFVTLCRSCSKNRRVTRNCVVFYFSDKTNQTTAVNRRLHADNFQSLLHHA